MPVTTRAALKKQIAAGETGPLYMLVGDDDSEKSAAAAEFAEMVDAERLLIPKREGKTADAEQERLEAFVKNPPVHATVVFVCGPLDKRRRIVNLLMKEAQVVDCGTI